MKHFSSCIDHTLLDQEATPKALQKLCQEAQDFHAACVCVYPQHLKAITQGIRRACVINFPHGDEPLETSLKTLDWIAAEKQAEEIDYVFPYALYLKGDTQGPLQQTKTFIETCKKHHLLIKVILETECFDDQDVLYTLAKTLTEYGADFLKTSTGSKPIGATLEASETLLKAIRDTACGIKISGGIRTLEKANTFIQQAESYCNRPIDASWFRIGSSQLLINIKYR